MNLNIKYKDAQNWTTLLGKVIDWSNYKEMYKDARIVPSFIAPVVITESWNGSVFDIQHKTWDVYSLDFLIKESEINQISKLQSCEQIIIEDLENKIYHEIEVRNFEYFEVTEPEKVENTTIFRVNIKYRINETTINKYANLTNKVTLTSSNTYYSKFDKLPLDTPSEKITITWSDGQEKVIRETKKTGYKVLLLLTDSELAQFNSDFLLDNWQIDGVAVLEKEIDSQENIGENINEIRINLVTSIERQTFNYNFGSNYLHINDKTILYDFYTSYPLISAVEDTEFLQFDNENGYKETAKTITRYISKFKIWLNEADAFSLKEHFERGISQINSISVLEKRLVKITELDYDLYLCEIDLLTNVDVNYPL